MRKGKSVAFMIDTSGSTSSFHMEYRQTIIDILQNFGPYDKAEIVQFVSAGGPSIVTYPATGPTDDMMDLIMYINSMMGPNYVNTFVYDGAFQAMSDLAAQPADPFRGMDAVVCFTDTGSPLNGAYSLVDCLDHYNVNGVPVYSITYAYANDHPELVELGGQTSGYYMPTYSPPEIFNAHYEVIDIITYISPSIYKIIWDTAGSSGDEIDVGVVARYYTTGGNYSGLDALHDTILP